MGKGSLEPGKAGSVMTRSVPPETIRWFELLFLGSLMLRAVEIPEFIAALSHGLTSALFATIRLLLFLLLPLWLALLVSRNRSNGAKWGLILLVALTIVGILAVPLTGQTARLNLLLIPVALMQGGALVLLFTASGRRWLDSKGTLSTDAELQDTFD